MCLLLQYLFGNASCFLTKTARAPELLPSRSSRQLWNVAGPCPKFPCCPVHPGRGSEPEDLRQDQEKQRDTLWRIRLLALLCQSPAPVLSHYSNMSEYWILFLQQLQNLWRDKMPSSSWQTPSIKHLASWMWKTFCGSLLTFVNCVVSPQRGLPFTVTLSS